MAKDASSKAAIAKSDAIILDLRSSQRQLKRQLDQLQEERAGINRELQKAKQIANAAGAQNVVSAKQFEQIQALQAHIEDITKQLEQSQQIQKQQAKEISESAHSRASLNDDSKNEKVGELEVQLDRAHAQILTADMVRKELEDTLEAEQYTWELRVQDQERQIVKLQELCDTLSQDLEQCRSQWKEAEVGWNQELNELKDELAMARSQLQHQSENGNNNDRQRDLFQKIHQLESERAELQSCLDEALKELEAVDEELKTEGGEKGKKTGNNAELTESLKHLLRWIYQEGPIETRVGHKQLSSLDNNPQEIISLIQKALEDWLEITSQTANLEGFSSSLRRPDDQATIDKLSNQVSFYEQELKSREETSAELRESLKEAVSLLKPLQDAVAQSEEEKNAMQQQLQDLEQDRRSSQNEVVQQSQRINMLQEQVSSLEEQLGEEKRFSSARESLLKAQAQNVTPLKQTIQTNDDDALASIKKAREELRRKRETESNLQQLLKDAQSRFNTLHDRNEDMNARNRELQGRIEQLGTDGEEEKSDKANGTLLATLAERDEEVRSLRLELERMRVSMQNESSQHSSMGNNQGLQEELEFMRRDVAQREHVNRVLNKSLKEALGLLKPLQMHLEEAEQEKTQISAELRSLRKRFRQLQMEGDDHSRSTHTGGVGDVSIELIKMKDELEETVRQLEIENSQLHDALEDMTEDGRQNNSDAKLRQKFVELNSRYEVTQNKLENAQVENLALAKALKQKEVEERKRQEDIVLLEEELRKSETELANAKRVAQTALVKVEELTMSNIEQLSLGKDTRTTADMTDSVKSPGNRNFEGPYGL